jgi:hypothetical protein
MVAVQPRAGWLLALVLGALTACSGSGHVAVTVSPSATPSRSPSPTQATHPFPTDVSFVSATRGWAIGPGRLERTDDGGTTWLWLPVPPRGVDQVRFASRSIGYSWADDGRLWTTSDGGESWRSGGLGQVRAFETAAGLAWAFAGEFPYPDLWRASVGSTQWRKLGGTPDRGDTLDVHGSIAYVMGMEGAGPISPSLDVWSGSENRNELLPCTSGRNYVPSSPVGVSTDGSLFLVCNVSNNRSTDEGRTWTAVLPPPLPADDVTAVAGHLFAWQSDLVRTVGGRWQLSLRGPRQAPDNGPAFPVVGFQDDEHGVALTASNSLYVTRDAGTSWRLVRF